MIDVQQPFARVLPRDFSPWVGDKLFKGREVKVVQKSLPQGDDPGKQWVRQSFKYQSGEVSSGHGCDGIDRSELLLQYKGGYVPGLRRLVRAAPGHLTGRPCSRSSGECVPASVTQFWM